MSLRRRALLHLKRRVNLSYKVSQKLQRKAKRLQQLPDCFSLRVRSTESKRPPAERRFDVFDLYETVFLSTRDQNHLNDLDSN